MKNKVTISTIAKVLGVSPMTVSRALGSRPGVSKELQETIIKKAQELGYKGAKSCGKLNILLLVRKRYIGDNSNFSLKVQGLEKYIKEAGSSFTMEFVDQDKQAGLTLPYNISQGNHFDALVLLGMFPSEYILYLKEIIPHLVVFHGLSEEASCDYINVNHNAIGFQGTKHVLGRGHRRVGFIGTQGKVYNCQRFLGYAKALTQQGIDVHEEYIIEDPADLRSSVDSLITTKKLPTAFICNTDHTARELIKHLHEHQISCPAQVSVVGCGNTEMASVAYPSLTTFDLHIDYGCQLAVEGLLARSRKPGSPYTTTFIEALLVEGQSVSTVPVGVQ